METAAAPAQWQSKRPTYACNRCVVLKVKCDRQRPCDGCVKRKTPCEFRLPPPPLCNKRTLKRTNNTGGSNDALEQLPTPLSTAASGQEPQRPLTRTQLLQGEGSSKFIDTRLWVRVVEELHGPDEAYEDAPYDVSDTEASDDELDYVLDATPKFREGFAHPPADRIDQLWQIFVDNFDPLTKIVHVPTLRPAIWKAAQDISNISKNFAALLFAIYGAAVMTLKDEECSRRFGECRKTLLALYNHNTKRALSQAKFLATKNIVVLQALVIHLFAVRDVYQPRAFRSVCGVAVGLAEGMGLHCDGSLLGLSPFETEIRRRIWCQLIALHRRTAGLCGMPKFQVLDTSSDAPKQPANVNDKDLSPDMPEPAPESTKPTDMIFCLSKGELGNYAVKQWDKIGQEKGVAVWDDIASIRDMKEKDELLQEFEENMELKFLRFCNPLEPLQLMTMLVVRGNMDISRFIAHHPRRWTPEKETSDSEKQFVWSTSIKILELDDMLHSNRQIQRFAWNVPFDLQWHAFIHVLDTLRANPLMPEAEQAWKLVGRTYENNPDIVSNTKRHIHVVVGTLCLMAFKAREDAFQNQGRKPSCEPHFIAQLRQNRDAVKVRRQSREAKRRKLDFREKAVGQSSDHQRNMLSKSDPLWCID